MIQIATCEELLKCLVPPHCPFLYVFNKRRGRYGMFSRYDVYKLYSFLKMKEQNLFDRWDVYRVETKDEYEKLRCMLELVS